ncbi:MAG TPA: nucleotide exchange factor GrpE [Thermoanaerobaculia bacterium]|jgi:molecular chaperone GrpE|nr:nucleotide exchange factor GrpE [Thermoanaerobaculia bacterium]
MAEPTGSDDDRYVLEDDGASVEDIEHEMQKAAHEAIGQAAGDGAPSNASQAQADPGVAEWRDRYLRTLADFDNYRKRADREKQDFFKYALAGTLRDLLPVLDNFDRALDHAEQGDEFHRGVSLIYKQLFDVLTKHGVRVIEESNVRFDPNIHEAVVREENPSVPSHTVVQVLQKGYFLHDRLLRPAMVKVAVGGPEEEATA